MHTLMERSAKRIRFCSYFGFSSHDNLQKPPAGRKLKVSNRLGFF
jgi:hypothetical protein